jgi:hypothetical protein
MKEEEIAPGISMIGFEDAEEAFNYMNDAELQSILHALDEQWRIGWGSYVLRIVDELWIFGHIFSHEELVAEVTEPGKAPDEEALYELRMHQASYDRGYRYGRWYSQVVPEGEYGSAHVAALWEITVEDFNQARALGWLPGSGLGFRVGMEVGEAMKKKRDQEQVKEDE